MRPLFVVHPTSQPRTCPTALHPGRMRRLFQAGALAKETSTEHAPARRSRRRERLFDCLDAFVEIQERRDLGALEH